MILVVKPLAVVVLAVILSASPTRTPVRPFPKDLKELHAQWVQKIFDHHHKLTDIKLIYTRLPLEKKNFFKRPLKDIDGLYQRAVEILAELERTDAQRWRALEQGLQKISHQIELNQNQLKANLTPSEALWVYQI